jgi:hypothetical protein
MAAVVQVDQAVVTFQLVEWDDLNTKATAKLRSLVLPPKVARSRSTPRALPSARACRFVRHGGVYEGAHLRCPGRSSQAARATTNTGISTSTLRSDPVGSLSQNPFAILRERPGHTPGTASRVLRRD